MLMVMNSRKRSYSWEKNRSSPNREILHLLGNWKFLTKVTLSHHSVFTESVHIIIIITKVVAVAVVVNVIITKRGIANSVYISHVMIVRFVAQWLPNFTLSRWQETFAENCVLLAYYATSSDNSLPTFRDKLSVPFSS